MKKFLIIFLFSLISYAKLIDAIVATVKDEPITLLDVKKVQNQYNVSKKEAIDILIQEKLEEIEAKKLGIEVDDYDFKNFVQKLADSQNMTYEQIVAIATKEYGSFQRYKEITKKNILKERLYRHIARTKLTEVSDDDIKIFYQNNKEMFNIASKIDIVEYFSINPKLLEEIKKNPLLSPKGVKINEKILYQDQMSASYKYIINSLKVGEFSAILPMKNGYLMIYIKDKKDITSLSLGSVKNRIYSILMQQRQKQIVKEYFDRLRLNTEIHILRG